MNFQNRFKHGFEETEESMKRRNWVEDTSIDSVLKEIKEEFVSIDHNGKEELFCDLYLRHHFYCSATTPFDTVVYDGQEFNAHLATANAGDFIEVWSLTSEPKYFIIKCPNEDGLFPTGGAY